MFYSDSEKPFFIRLGVNFADIGDNPANVVYFYAEDIVANSFSFDQYLYNSSEYSIGNLTSGEIRFSLLRNSNTQGLIFEGARINFKVNDRSISQYIIDSVFYTENTIDIMALDQTVLLDRPADFEWQKDAEGNYIPYKLKDLATLCWKNGTNNSYGIVLYDFCLFEKWNKKNPTNKIDYQNLEIEHFNHTDVSYRFILKKIAEILGTNGVMSYGNKNVLYFITPSMSFETGEPVYEIAKEIRMRSSVSESPCTITGFKVKPYPFTDEERGLETTVGTTDYMMVVSGNPLIRGIEKAQQIANWLQIVYNGFSFHSIDLETQPIKALGTFVNVMKERFSIDGKPTMIAHYTFRLHNTTRIRTRAATRTQKGWAELNPYTKQERAIIEKTNVNFAHLTRQQNAVRFLNEMLAGASGLERTVINEQVYFYNQIGAGGIENATFIVTIGSNGFGFTDSWNGGNPIFTNGYNALSDEFLMNYLMAKNIYVDRFVVPIDATPNTAKVYFDKESETQKIGGFEIGTSKLKNGKQAYNDNNDGVYIGTDGIGLGKDKFYVDKEGNIKSVAGLIGGFTLSDGSFWKDIDSMSSPATNGVYLGTDGIRLGNKFKVTPDGKITSSTGDFTSAEITSANIYNTFFTNIKAKSNATNPSILLGDVEYSKWWGTFVNGLQLTKSSLQIGNSTNNKDYQAELYNNSLELKFNKTRTKIDNNSGYSYLSFENKNTLTSFLQTLMYMNWTSNVGINTHEMLYKAKTGASEMQVTGLWKFDNLVSTSDKRKKNSIEPLDDRYSKLFDKLKPVRFKFNNRENEGYHLGFIAQEVGEAREQSNMQPDELALHYAEEEGQGIRYHEIIAMCVKEIQELKAINKELSEKVQKLEQKQ